ncbi:hypothetical protein CL621_00205 [archaeon]|nr:hypothetical protein [archaeon]|tara:strand:- start:383 stop:790 length:408 start_codon:yes stop_codon:yes gene_type:complete
MKSDTLKPLHDAKESLDKVIKLTFDESKDVRQLKKAWLDVAVLFRSGEFRKYREAYGKVSLMVPKSDPGVNSEDPFDNSYFQAMVNVLGHYDNANHLAATGRIDSKEFLVNVGAIKTYLNLMEENHEILNEIMRH